MKKMGIKETAIKMAVKKGVKYLKEDVDTNSIKLIDKGLKLTEGKDLYHNALLKLRAGMVDPNHHSIHGWHFSNSSTGIHSLGGNYFYISHPKKNKPYQSCTAKLYKFVAKERYPFEEVK
jgi:hypothetical protein